MKILFDKCTPVPLARYLVGQEVVTFDQTGWDPRLEDAEVLKLAAEAGFEMLITTDQNLPHQQNLAQFPMAIVILGSNRWPWIKAHIDDVVGRITRVKSGSLVEIPIMKPG